MNKTTKDCIDCEHLMIVSGGGWCLKDGTCEKVDRSLSKANPDALLVEVQRLGELLEMMDKYMPDESSTLGELYHRSMKQYDKVIENINEEITGG